jgi:hypothetical protein
VASRTRPVDEYAIAAVVVYDGVVALLIGNKRGVEAGDLSIGGNNDAIARGAPERERLCRERDTSSR